MRGSVLIALILTGLMEFASADARGAEPIQIEVRETAGIRRFQYPVAVALPRSLETSTEATYIVREQDRATAAQVRPVENADGKVQWWADFNVDLLPYETKTYSLQRTEPPAEPGRGFQFETVDDVYRIINGPYITWQIQKSPKNWLQSVAVPGFEHVRREGSMFVLYGRDGERHVLGEDGTWRTRVVRSGPMAVAIEYAAEWEAGPLEGVTSRMTLTFPLAKSWVEIDWQLADPQRRVSRMALEIAQNIDAPTGQAPTMVDFGASTLVYLTVPASGVAELRALTSDDGSEPLWQVLRGSAERLEPYVTGGRDAERRAAEGWAHVMDRTRCMALAVEEFGPADVIQTSGTGDVEVRREATRIGRDGHARLRTWLHFIAFPPQHTAATSPQSMQNPPEITVR